MRQRKKSERRFTTIRNFKHYVSVLLSHGEKIAFRYFDTPAGKEIVDVTYRQLAERIKAEAAGFAALGLAGKRIALLGETSVSWVASYVAAVAGGSVAIPMDKELDFDEILGFFEMAQVDAVVYSAAFEAKMRPVVGRHPTVRWFLPMTAPDAPAEGGDGPAADGSVVVPIPSVIERGAADTAYDFPDTADIDRMAEMLFTSGTTGTSKCVMLSERNVVAAMNSACGTVEFFPEDTIVSVLPIHHTYELCCMLAGLNYGMTVGINDSLKHVLRSLKAFRPTGLVLVPLFVETFHKRIWDEARKKGKDKKLRFGVKLSRFLRFFGIDVRRRLFGELFEAFGGRLERIVCGGAPLSREVMRDFDDFGITIMEGYGITECSPLISVDPYYALKPGSVGPAVPSCTVRIDDAKENDAGHDEGEIVVRGDNVMLGYYHNEEENQKAFTPDGWYRTGDIGYMDADGYIYITGRKKSVIVLESGKNVFPEEIEEYLARIPGVGESVVVGRKNPEDGHVILTAIVYPDPETFPDTPQDEIYDRLRAEITALNKKLVAFKHIQALELRDDPFEKTTSRKIKRHLVH